MTLPNFIGIGSMRCGSSWLHTLLDSHPHIFVPQKRIEVNYFTNYYYKGQDWYETYFPEAVQTSQYQAIGEVSPEYICFPEAIPRIQAVPSITKFLTIFRDPVKRAHSDYGLAVREGRYTKPFVDYVEDHPTAIDFGMYARQMQPYLDHFPRDIFLNLIFEQSTSDVVNTRAQIAQFFGVDPSLFPPDAGLEKVNSTYIPRNKWLSLLAVKVLIRLRRADLDGVVSLAKKLGVKSVLGAKSNTSLPPIDPDVRRHLLDRFMPDIEKLEQMLDIDLECWKTFEKVT